MKLFSILAIAVLALASTGCEMVDSQIIQQVQEYFPQAELSHPVPSVIVIRLHVGNVTEKFAELVIAQMIRDHCCHGLQGIPQDLDFALPAGGYNNLTVAFNETGCGWNPNNTQTLTCVTYATQQRHDYSIYDQVTFPPIQIVRPPVRRR